ncbi:amino acid adenylation domain-containing protein [Chondromyces crocatus]|uniref:Nonribosomal peptide synthase n=1 Tax=Chondromyces crocatus TaxID=52 RepID=A0A0K1EHI7_CHOCO|nr:amino acid adenylation domain-containing protein [Chondromyces crocatus]AKT40132.1 nonribosomal peptide synthase [Chondromyces crocatus]
MRNNPATAHIDERDWIRAELELVRSTPEQDLAPHDAKSIEGLDARLCRLAAWNDTHTDYPKDANVCTLFEAIVSASPESPAVRCEGKTLSYAELNRRANRLARNLKGLGVGPGVHVALFVERSINLLVGLLGTLKAGGVHVPIDPGYPEERIHQMMETVQAKVLLSGADRPAPSSFEGQHLILCDGEITGVGDAEESLQVSGGSLDGPDDAMSCPSGAEDPAYVMFTSGSTGRPKGVSVSHRAIVRLVISTNYVAFAPDDRVMQGSNPSFDASILEVWGALLHGAQLEVFGQPTLLSPGAFREKVKTTGITKMFLTTSLFHHLADAVPDAFDTVHTLVVGGDALDPRWAAAVLERGGLEYLVNGYGPTETTTFATAHVLSSAPPQAKSLPIGKPISNSRAYVLDAHLQPPPVGIAGELYVGGHGVGLGYLNEPQLTAQRFLPDPFSAEPGARMYRTGDEARCRPDGSIEFLGRRDRQVKIRGFRIEPAEIEAILAVCPMVKEAALVVREDSPGDKRLVVYAASTATPAALRAYLTARLPPHHVPSRFVLMPSLPLTPNGKIDRAALPVPSRVVERSEVDERDLPSSSLERKLAAMWQELLRVDLVLRQDSFFELGGDSLLVARLLLRIEKEFEVSLPAEPLFTHPTFEALAQLVERRVRDEHQPSPGISQGYLTAEAILDPNIAPGHGKRASSAPPRHLLLTGATGFLGPFLLRDLLRSTDAQIHCLVRAANPLSGLHRIQETLVKYGLGDEFDPNRIVPVLGNLGGLGLGTGELEQLHEQIDAIYHSGAEISYVKPYQTHRDTNVGGTREILRLACTGKTKPLHYLSTVAVFGHLGHFTGTHIIREDEDLDHAVPHLGTEMGYSQSKWVAEKLVTTARGRGLPVNIYRPGFILGDSITGASNENDFIFRLIKGCILAGCFPALPRQRKVILPVDYASAAITSIALNPQAVGGTYHIVPSPAHDVELIQFFEWVVDAGYPLKKLPYADWVDRVVRCVETTPYNPLLPLVPMLTERVHDGLTRWELYEDMPAYDDSNARRALAGTGIACPVLDAARLNVYLNHQVRSGYLPEPRKASRVMPRAEAAPAEKAEGSISRPSRALEAVG